MKQYNKISYLDILYACLIYCAKFTMMNFLDDCLYLYYVCTDKLGTWPENKQKCFQTFENCQTSIGNTDDDYDFQFLSTSQRPTNPIRPVATPTTAPTTTTIRPAPSTTQRPITTTTKVRIFSRKIFFYVKSV